MYEQLSLFDLDPKINPQKETLFEQLLPVVKNSIILCANCLCQYCTHNVEELYNTVKLEEAADEPCFICDECRVYSGETTHKVCQKMDCENFVMSNYGAKRNRKRFKLVKEWLMKVWITKYALTSGIKEIECEDCENGAVKEIENPFPTFYHDEGKEWHRTKESAIQKAEEMRQKKIASLKKQIEKLERIRFE